MAAKHKRHGRSIARESALALLYSSDITESDVVDIVESGRYPADGINLGPYAEALVRGVNAHRKAIDRYLRSTSENWAVDRMPVVDRAILRLAAYEMIYVDEVPVSVTINEAVDLAKAYGGEDDSSRFVNGVLGRIARQIESGEIVPAIAQGAKPEAESGEAPAEGGEEGVSPEPEAVADAEPAPATEEAPAEPIGELNPQVGEQAADETPESE